MGNDKRIGTRIIHTHDIEENWNKHPDFVPESGEIIVYDPDDLHPYQRFKIGNGINNITSLLFSSYVRTSETTGSAGAYRIENVVVDSFDVVAELEPDIYYTYGLVNSLTLTLRPLSDGYIHEYGFEFIPTEDFTKMTVYSGPGGGEVKWATPLQFPAGKKCQVSIMENIGVMVCA